MTEYDLGKVVGDDGEAGNGIASITKTGTSGLVDTYTITYDDGTTTTFTVTNGSDASVTIQTSWGSTTSDSKVPSEKLTKDSLDNKASSTHTHGNLTNDGKVGSNANYFVVTGTSGAITSQQKIGNIDTSGKIGSTSGKPVITTTGGTVTTGSFGSTSGTFAEGNHTHSAYVNPTKVTSWSATVSDDNVASEKLIKDSLDDKVSKSSTTGLLKNDGSVMTSGTGSSNWAVGNHTHSAYVNPTKVTSWSSTPSNDNVASEKLIKDTLDTKQATLVSGTNIKTINNETLLGSGNITIQGGSSVDVVTSWEATLSDSKVPSEKLVKNTIDGLSIPSDVSDLTDTQNTAFTPKSHTHGNLTNDGKVGSNANYIVVTTTGGAITSVQKLGNITYDGKIGSTSGKPVITTTGGTVTTGSFGSTSGTFAEGNHTHSGYISTSSTTGLVKNDGSIMTSGTGSSNWATGNHTHSGYVSATKVTSWQSTPSDSNVPSEKLVKDSLDDIEDLIGDAIAYINQ